MAIDQLPVIISDHYQRDPHDHEPPHTSA